MKKAAWQRLSGLWERDGLLHPAAVGAAAVAIIATRIGLGLRFLGCPAKTAVGKPRPSAGLGRCMPRIA